MLWTDRPNRLAGVILLVLAVLLIVSMALQFGISDSDPFEKDEINKVLIDIKDHQAVTILHSVASFAVDSVVGLAAAAALYLLFRDRSRVLALFGLVGILVASAAFIAADAADVALVHLASDFKGGGPEGVAAKAPVILEVARAVAISSGVAGQIGFTALSFGILAFGVLIGWAPAGAVTPPRWVGWVALLAGVVGFFTWLIAVTDAAFVLIIIATVTQLIWLFGLGGWLLMQPDEATA